MYVGAASKKFKLGFTGEWLGQKTPTALSKRPNWERVGEAKLVDCWRAFERLFPSATHSCDV